jgi:hypothetical protein
MAIGKGWSDVKNDVKGSGQECPLYTVRTPFLQRCENATLWRRYSAATNPAMCEEKNRFSWYEQHSTD